MVRQSNFPPKWTCETEQKQSKLELRVPDGDGSFTWIEVPVVKAELYIEKGDAALIQRTAKIKIPTTWGRDTDDVIHNSPRELLRQFDDQQSEPFMFARLSLKDAQGNYQYAHFGWIGGVGPAEQRGVTKLWLYDVAEMMQGIPITATFNNPTVKSMAEQIAKLVGQNSPIPIGGVDVVPPNTEEEFSILAENIDTNMDRDNIVHRLFGRVDIDASGTAYYYLGPFGMQPEEAGGDAFEARVITSEPVLGRFGEIIGQTNTETLTFTSNHDTMQDVVGVFEKRTGAKVHFEPSPTGESVIMMFDIIPSRRTFAQDVVVQQKIENGEGDYAFHDLVGVIKNDALYEMKPINTLYLRGDTSRSYRHPDLSEPLGSPYGVQTDTVPSRVYPSVKVQVPSLVQAAEGFELSVTIESDAETIETAKKEAVAELTRILEEETEGHVKLFGQPKIMPFDRLDAYEACGTDIEFERDPARYEVESVKHTTGGKDVFTTRVTVSVWANDETMEVVYARMEEA